MKDATATEMLEAMTIKVKRQNEESKLNSFNHEHKQNQFLFPNAPDKDAQHLTNLNMQIHVGE